MSLTVYYPSLDDPARQARLDRVLSQALAGREVQIIRRAEDLDQRGFPRILFALPLDEAGQNFEYFRMLARLRREANLLEGCTGGLIVDGPGELYTKSTAAELALAMNLAGCALVGRPLVEATGSLANFRIQAKNLGTDLVGAYEAAARELADQAEAFVFPARKRPNLLALHASSHHTSNTMALWGEAPEAPVPPVAGGGDRSAQRHPVRLLRLPLHHVPPLRRARGLLLRRRHVRGGLPRRAEGGRPHPHVPQLQRRPVRQPHRLYQPPHRPVPADPVL